MRVLKNPLSVVVLLAITLCAGCATFAPQETSTVHHAEAVQRVIRPWVDRIIVYDILESP